MLKSTESGYFFKNELKMSELKFRNVIKCTLPDEYVLKMQKSMRAINSDKDYGFFEKAKIINCSTNVNYIVCTTNQNLIFIWKKAAC